MTIKKSYLDFKNKPARIQNNAKHKKSIFNIYTKPHYYYGRLIIFFLLISLILSFSLMFFQKNTVELFILKYFIILFLILTMSVFIEFFYKSEYISPYEITLLENFFRKFLLDAYSNSKDLESDFFNKYDLKTKRKFKELFNTKNHYFLSSIRKDGQIYEITFINKTKMFEFFLLSFLRFFIKDSIHRIFVRKINNHYKIVRFE